MPRVLFLMPTKTYRASAFLKAAELLKLDVIVASDRRQALEEFSQGKTLYLDFYDLEKSTDAIFDSHKTRPLHAIVPVDDDTAVLAAAASAALSLDCNPAAAVRATREKHRMRECLLKAGLPTPASEICSTEAQPDLPSPAITYPCVLKPVFLSASRGVIRANNDSEFKVAFKRLARLLQDPDIRKRGGELSKLVLVEGYLPGSEVALEGILSNGGLKVLAIFDKPDPLEGPYFEETIYVTPSRLEPAIQEKIKDCTSQAARALALRHGPVHAELRIHKSEPKLLEIAARSIGGLCANSLRFDENISLEELILRHALGMNVEDIEREKLASGVMMIPIPKAGILNNVEGVEAAKSVRHIEDVRITIPPGQTLVPLPEGNRYLGFIFARANLPNEVENAIRKAFEKLNFEIEAA